MPADPGDLARRLAVFSYPVADYLRIAWNAADRLEPRLGSVEAVWEELGRRTVNGFLASTLGRTIFALAGRDPRRFVAAGPAGYRSAVSYGERAVRWNGEKAARAKHPKVVARATGLLDSEYDIAWE